MSPPVISVLDDDTGVPDYNECTCETCVKTRRDSIRTSKWTLYDNIDPLQDSATRDELEKTPPRIQRHIYFLCPRNIKAFVLKSRVWGKQLSFLVAFVAWKKRLLETK